MSGIVCAIRGGPESQTTIAKAVSLAQETDQVLCFLYVVNLDFLAHTSSSRTHTISQEMHQMGEFILLAAQATAEAREVTSKGFVRHGNVQDEIIAICHELEATYLVMGWPKLQRETSVFTQALLDSLIERTEEQTGAKVVLPEREDSPS